jgi:hypothetical protein
MNGLVVSSSTLFFVLLTVFSLSLVMGEEVLHFVAARVSNMTHAAFIGLLIGLYLYIDHKGFPAWIVVHIPSLKDFTLT